MRGRIKPERIARVVISFALASIVLSTGCALLLKTGWLPDRFPSYETHHYSHQLHIKEVGLDCDFCHDSIWESDNANEKHTPPMETCLLCHYHKRQFNEKDCQNCHIVPEAKIPQVLTALHFSHEQHLGIAGMEESCDVCHVSNLTSTRQKDRNIPNMQICLNCHYHDEQYQNLQCLNCHTDMWSIGLKPLSRFSHKGNFLRDHKHYAWSQTEVCAQCHSQDDCMECHADNSDELTRSMKQHGRVNAAFIHQPDYLSRHFIEARNDPSLCITCHRPSYCETCHRAHGISDIAGQDQRADSPHPRGFADEFSPNFHGQIARREIANCASCHDQGADSICIECHATYNDNINPHPKGWTSDKDMFRDRPCLYCHVQE
ncbi:MAG: hypothetical protein H6752_16150 [Candidatus Omnitrophica bacterium]|nr:hypothetical protein [Candidatus Omnitrophota bacterium]